MHSTSEEHSTHDIGTFVRNRYFHGKLLDVFHFELEQGYLNGKRWLLNRVISGYGVVCGLDVLAAREGRAVVVSPGIALDRGGHEILVPRTSAPVTVPSRSTKEGQSTSNDCDKNDYVHLCISFMPCEADPTPVLVDDCGQATSCSASSVQERYKLQIRQGKAPEIELECAVADFVLNGRVNYHALVERVTRMCPTPPSDLCVPLANIHLPDGDQPVQSGDIDICVRPIVYTNDLLFDILLSLTGDSSARPRGGKQ